MIRDDNPRNPNSRTRRFQWSVMAPAMATAMTAAMATAMDSVMATAMGVTSATSLAISMVTAATITNNAHNAGAARQVLG